MPFIAEIRIRGSSTPDRLTITIRFAEDVPATNAENVFTTYEKVETIPLIVIKKDNNREAFDRSKIEAGVLRACYKRPVSAEDIKRTVDEIELEVVNREEKEIPSNLIGEIVMDKLKLLDPVVMSGLHRYTVSLKM